ncbi:MAG: SMC-Scp complex subunit ScpB [Bdellovibrionales bacterium]|nr:SMC-Scp complex subunit ScpB [Bdellovibrionales bacterium]
MTEQNSTKPTQTEENSISMDKLCSILDSLFFVSDRILSLSELEEVLTEFSTKQIKESIQKLIDINQSSETGVELVEVRGGYQYRTKVDNKDWIIRFQKAKPQRLSRAALESLSIIAYRQPVTRPEVDEIRGVDSSGVIRMLLERGLVRILGKRDEPGHPLLYGTSKEFLSFFNLKNLSDLPPLKEYTELGEDSMKKLQTLFPDHEPSDIEKRVEDENILPVDAEEVDGKLIAVD